MRHLAVGARKDPLHLHALGVALAAAAVLSAASCDDMYGCTRTVNPSGYSVTSECTRLAGNRQKLTVVLNYGTHVETGGWTTSSVQVVFVRPEWRHLPITDTLTDVAP